MMEREQIKESTVKALKKKYGMEEITDFEFTEWWRRNHGTGYPIEIMRGKQNERDTLG